jgi:DNA sulfur modification protein DndD
MVAGLLPFAICPELAERVSVRLEDEQAHEEREIVLRRINSARRSLSARLSSKSTASVHDVISKVLAGDTDPAADARIHDLTTTERAVLADQLQRVRDQVPNDAAKLARTLRRAEEARARSRELLDKAPDQSDVSDRLIALQQLDRELGAMGVERERAASGVQRAEYECKVAERELRRAREALNHHDGLNERVGHAVRAAAVLDEFEDRALISKLGKIEVEAARYFNRLSRKGSLLSRVQIDPQTFRVELRRWDDAELPKERLSAGEKQLMAIALLWALAHVARRPLPVVIDTPLARLDMEHRHRLLREYLPSVSHQVIVLSTDTEVDAVAAEVLAPAIARTFHLVHDAEHCCTSIRDGYFAAQQEALGAG